jgi:isopentenyl-diphosphate Delta-isomerase
MSENDINKLVLLVDEEDNEIGIYDKLKAHEECRLHRAFSIFIFNCEGELLLQQRAKSKYHSGGLWTNSCCSHPLPGKTIEESVAIRTREELGIEVEDIRPIGKLLYMAELENGLCEHELDHIFVGKSSCRDIPFNPSEVESVRFAGFDQVVVEVRSSGGNDTFTEWFKFILRDDILVENIRKNITNT